MTISGKERGHETPNVSKSSNTKSTLSTIFVFIFGLFLVSAVKVIYFERQEIQSDDTSQSVKIQAIINQAVMETKDKMDLPARLNDGTMLVDLTAETNAMRYHYKFATDTDTAGVTVDSLKQRILPVFCKDASQSKVLSMGVNIEYQYVLNEGQHQWLVVLRKSDCHQ